MTDCGHWRSHRPATPGGRSGSSLKCKRNLLYIYIKFCDFIVKYFCLMKIARAPEIFWLRHRLRCRSGHPEATSIMTPPQGRHRLQLQPPMASPSRSPARECEEGERSERGRRNAATAWQWRKDGGRLLPSCSETQTLRVFDLCSGLRVWYGGPPLGYYGLLAKSVKVLARRSHLSPVTKLSTVPLFIGY